VRVVGNARLWHPDVSISAATLWADTVEKIAAASGDVRVEAENGVLTGDEFVYCFDSGSAFLSNASAELTVKTDAGEMTVYFAGREIRYDEETARVIDGSFTTCGKEEPDYLIKAKEWKLGPEGSLTAKGARVRLYHMRLPSFPTLRINLGRRQAATSLVPAIGISSRDGLYAFTSLQLTPKGRRPAVKAEGRLSFENLFRGRIYAAVSDEERRSINVVIGLNEDVRDDLTRNIVLDRLPEVVAAGEWGLGGRDRSAWYANAAVGSYRESPGRAEAWRESVQVGARHSVNFAGGAEGTLELSFRQSFYSRGESLSITTAKIGAAGTIGRRFGGAARYVRRFGNGRSPFEFDDIDIEQEMFTRFGWSFGQWGIGAAARYDIDRGEFRRAQLRLNKLFHCIQYGVTYDTVLREVGLRVTLPGT